MNKVFAAIVLVVLPSTSRAVADDTFWYAIDLRAGICKILDNSAVARAHPALVNGGWQQSTPSNDSSLTFSGEVEGMPSSIILFQTRSGCIEGLRLLKRALQGLSRRSLLSSPRPATNSRR
jgi:hypothetical protein